MKILGYISELDGTRFTNLPSLAQISQKLDPDAKQIVLEYLSHGTTFFDAMEATPDPLIPGKSVLGGSSLVTDGYWIWRLDLANYVSAHNIELPDELIQTARVAAKSRSFPVVSVTQDLVNQALAKGGWL
jgi:hypothetical protein